MAELYYQDTVRFKTTVNGATKYLTLAVVAPTPGAICWLTLTDEPTQDSNFLIREWNYENTGRFCFSGNEGADTPDSHGNFRMLHKDTRPPEQNVGDDHCISLMPHEGVTMGYWGIPWATAYDFETFALFATRWKKSDGGVCSGDPVKIKSLMGAKERPGLGSIGLFLTINVIDGQWRLVGDAEHGYYDAGTEFVIEKVE
jgi:hypothetical protein